MVDANISAALVAKLLRIVPLDESSFLSFPVGGAAFTRQDLEVFVEPDDAAELIREKAHRKAQFARLMNAVPVDRRSWAATDQLLWSEYESVLQEAEMADSVLTDAERIKLQKARDYLTDTVNTEGGATTVYSAPVVAYYQYKEAAEELERTYLDEKLTVEMSQDPAVKSTWDNGRHQELEGARNRAQQDWQTLGYKSEVESAQATVSALSGKDPEVRRVGLLRNCETYTEPDLVANDPLGVRSTFYSPSDVFDLNTTWNNLHLTADEIRSLLGEVPEELKPGVTALSGDIVSATIEYTIVTVMRPWFDPGFFAMRSWRLPGQSLVSDGAEPATGRIPCYISSIIVARKIVLERTVPKGTDAQLTPPAGPSTEGWIFKGVRKLDHQWKLSAANQIARNIQIERAETITPPEVRREVTLGALTQPQVNAAALGISVQKLSSVVQPMPHLRVLLGSDLRGPRRSQDVRVRRPLPPPIVIPDPPLPSPPVEPAPAPPTPETTTVRTDELDLEGVVVLAYKLRRVPRAPDPDPALPWGSGPGQAAPAEPSTPQAQTYSLPQGHVFGRPKSTKVHDGTLNAEDRVSVLALQSALRKAGYSITVDGIYGKQTEQAVITFQSKEKLTQDGIVGPKTWKALQPYFHKTG